MKANHCGSLLVGLASLALAGCLLPRNLEPGDEDWAAIVTARDLAGWLDANAIELRPEVETLTKRKVAFSYELNYEFDGVEDRPDGKSMRVALRSEVTVHPNSPSALHNANTYWVGLKAGLWSGGASLERVEPTLAWGDGIDCFTIHKEGNQIGNLLIGHSGSVATYVLLTGLYSSDPALFEELVEPRLRALDSYDPATDPSPVAASD